MNTIKLNIVDLNIINLNSVGSKRKKNAKEDVILEYIESTSSGQTIPLAIGGAIDNNAKIELMFGVSSNIKGSSNLYIFGHSSSSSNIRLWISSVDRSAGTCTFLVQFGTRSIGGKSITLDKLYKLTLTKNGVSLNGSSLTSWNTGNVLVNTTVLNVFSIGSSAIVGSMFGEIKVWKDYTDAESILCDYVPMMSKNGEVIMKDIISNSIAKTKDGSKPSYKK